MNADFFAALETLEKEKGIDKEVLYEAIEAALHSAYKRNFNASAANARIEINRESGDIKVLGSFQVVEKVSNPQLEIELESARKYHPDIELGETLEVEVTPKEFGRIAAQTAKQVVIQRIREAEREIIYENYVDREQDVVTGLIQRHENKNVIIDLGRAEATLPWSEQIPGEKYESGKRIKLYIYEVKKTTKGPQIMVSRTHSGLLKRLFELEVPEIYEGLIEIRGVSREPGFRSKIAVWSGNPDIDPVGACVGPKGARVQTVSTELRGEKIDVIRWSEDPEELISNALSPARISMVKADQDKKETRVVVPDSQLSLAIGKEGQNARLAARLTGWKIDIISESKLEERDDTTELSPEDLSPEEVEASFGEGNQEPTPEFGKETKSKLDSTEEEPEEASTDLSEEGEATAGTDSKEEIDIDSAP